MKLDMSPPAKLLPWLSHSKKLSEKLNVESGDANLTVIYHHWTPTSWFQRYSLGIHDKKVLLREIVMQSHGLYCWYARSVFPQSCFDENPAFFGRLEKEPLGNLIYQHAEIERTLEFYPITTDNMEYYWLKKEWKGDANLLWLRRSKFSYRKSYSFYLLEIMLPGLLQCIQ
jgi:chorismate--pyruvate lyase